MSIATATWIDGEPATALPLPDRALEFGDGLFETLLLRRGKPLYQDIHLERLAHGLQVLDFPDCMAAAAQQLGHAAAAAGEFGWQWTALRLTVSRGSGPRGYAPPVAARPRIIITVTALERHCQNMSSPAKLSLSTVRWPTQPALAGLKHLNRLEQVMAAAQCRSQGADEALMLDQSGHLVSVVAGNLFLLSGGQLLTPALQHCGIAGTRRRLVIERWAAGAGLAVQECTLGLDQLASADEVFYSNSLMGVRPVSRCGELQWDSSAVCQALFEQYRRELP